MTGKQMCEKIVEAGFVFKDDGTPYTAKEIWEMSPRGELWHVYELYEMAVQILDEKEGR